MNASYTHFGADRGFRKVEQKPRLRDSAKNELLKLSDVHFAMVTGVYITRFTNSEEIEREDPVELITYTPVFGSNPQTQIPQSTIQWPAQKADESVVTFRNTSWGPYHGEAGDIVIVAAGCAFPLVLRKVDDKHLFMGGCWLIDSELRDLRNFSNDPGLLSLMFGKACEWIVNACSPEEFLSR